MAETVRLKPDTTREMRFEKPSLSALAWLVFYDVNRTLGGMASMELLRRSLGARGWIADEGHALFVAVSRLTPGYEHPGLLRRARLAARALAGRAGGAGRGVGPRVDHDRPAQRHAGTF